MQRFPFTVLELFSPFHCSDSDLIHLENTGLQLHKDAESLGNYPEKYSQKHDKNSDRNCFSAKKYPGKNTPRWKSTVEFSRKEKGLPGGKGECCPWNIISFKMYSLLRIFTDSAFYHLLPKSASSLMMSLAICFALSW